MTKEFKIALSSPYRVIDADSKYYFNEDGILITMKFAKKKLFIQKIDLISLKELSMREVTDLPPGYVTEGFVRVPGKILMFYSLWDKKNQTEQLFMREVDFEKGNMAAKPHLMIAVQGKITGSMVSTSRFGYGISVADKFSFDSSVDSSKLVIRYRKKPETRDDSKNYDVIGMNIYNWENGLSHLWGKEIKMPYTEQKMDELDFTVDSEGNSYFLSKIYEGDKKRVKDKEGFILYSVEIFKVDANTKELSQFKVTLPQKFIKTITMFETADNNLTLTGYYHSGNKKQSGVDGSFIAKFTRNGEITEINSFEIPLEIINQNVSKRAAAKNVKKADSEKGVQLDNLVFRSAKRRSDGSLLLVGEQYKVVVTHHTDSKGNVRTSTKYYYEDILVTKINHDGTTAWIKRLPKTQQGSKGRGGMSFKHIETNNNHYFLFLDNIKNVNLPADKEPARHADGAGGFLTAYKVNDNTGDVSKLYLFDTKKVDGKTEVFQFSPSRIFKGSENEFYLEVYKKSKEDILIKMTLAEIL